MHDARALAPPAGLAPPTAAVPPRLARAHSRPGPAAGAQAGARGRPPARAAVPTAAAVAELYSSIGRALKRVDTVYGQEATYDLWPRFRYIRILDALRVAETRVQVYDELRYIERELRPPLPLTAMALARRRGGRRARELRPALRCSVKRSARARRGARAAAAHHARRRGRFRVKPARRLRMQTG